MVDFIVNVFFFKIKNCHSYCIRGYCVPVVNHYANTCLGSTVVYYDYMVSICIVGGGAGEGEGDAEMQGAWIPHNDPQIQPPQLCQGTVLP